MRNQEDAAERLFEEALDLCREEWPAFLDRECDGQPDLRGRVEALLEQNDRLQGFLSESPLKSAKEQQPKVRFEPGARLDSQNTFHAAAAENFSARNASGAFVGAYELMELLGEGGMGEVWLAEQRQPVRRRVAVKLIKAGMDTREVVARFDSERQALAVMDHPAIARVFDAGETELGRPYFVMEYVAGEPITGYCDRKKLTVRQRVQLFILVCEGVQHAHQKAIIHRDLKPSNILVTEVDGKPLARIIDFGLAKAMSAQPNDSTAFTRIGAVMGTLGYMSPEQAEGGLDIDTRTDVYSLGVILYELVVGSPPLDFRNLANREALRRLYEQEAPKPSAKLRIPGKNSAVAAQNRGADIPELVREIRGDIDCIALKALEKDRDRRYATPLDLAADLDLYLHHEPVKAHPPSVAYRAGKYLRRHRLGVAVAACAILLLVGFAVAQSIQLRRIRQAQIRADRIAAFMTSMFRVSNPSEARGNTVTAREILDKASLQIGAELHNDPELRARLMQTMSQTYAGLGLYARAEGLLKQALAIERPLLGANNRLILATESELGQCVRAEGRPAEAEQSLRATLAAQQRALGPNDPDTIATMDRLAYTLSNEAHHAEAEALFRSTLAAERRALPPADPQALATLNELAESLTAQGHYADADQIYSELIAAQRQSLGADHPSTLLSMEHAAENFAEEGRYPEAEKLEREVIAAQTRILGPEHPQILRTETYLTISLIKEGRYAEADKLENQVIATERRVLGPSNMATLQSMEFEAICLSGEGRYTDADQMFHEVINIAGRTNQPAEVDEAWYNFATVEAARGNRDEALADLDRAVQNGLVSPGYLAADPELKSLHNDPRFNAAIAKARAATQAGAK
jgi:non-specific serine/threonine protein kinase/serine/threonine-protein kinase